MKITEPLTRHINPTLDDALTIGRDSIRFFQLPFPPSSNNQYLLFKRKGKTYHVPSQELKTFQNAMAHYPFEYPNAFSQGLKRMEAWKSQGALLEFQVVFFFQRSKIFTKDGRPKKIDLSNRLKALMDCVSTMLRVDDSIYFRIVADKGQIEGKENVCVQISPYV